jgi:hypothetical protein
MLRPQHTSIQMNLLRKEVKTMLGIRIEYKGLTIEIELSWLIIASIILIAIGLISGSQGLNS